MSATPVRDLPTFFFSHARQDREMPGKHLDRFFEDLDAKVAQYAAIDRTKTRLGTIDKQVLQGADWDQFLSKPLSTDRAFIAIYTPLYFTRENCGKELYAFVMRSAALGIDSNGALTGAENVVPIRWLREEAYHANTQKDSIVPPILKLLSDTPADNGGDQQRTEAIQNYRKKGMERCVNWEPHYGELLDAFALLIAKQLKKLPAGAGISFAKAQDAFTYDWHQHFTATGTAATVALAAPETPQLVTPRPLTSVVMFYITGRRFLIDPHAANFADQLIAEPLSGTASTADPTLTSLLVDVRTAAVAERFMVFHAAADPVIPTGPDALLARLSSLSAAGVLTCLVIDPAVLVTAPGSAVVRAVEEIVRSSKWVGPVLLPVFDGPSAAITKLIAARDFPPRVADLPQASELRVTALRRVFVEARGRVLRMNAEQAPNAERLPLLKGVGEADG